MLFDFLSLPLLFYSFLGDPFPVCFMLSNLKSKTDLEDSQTGGQFHNGWLLIRISAALTVAQRAVSYSMHQFCRFLFLSKKLREELLVSLIARLFGVGFLMSTDQLGVGRDFYYTRHC